MHVSKALQMKCPGSCLQCELKGTLKEGLHSEISMVIEQVQDPEV